MSEQEEPGHISRLEKIAKPLREPQQPYVLVELANPLPPVETLRALVQDLRTLSQQKKDLDDRYRLLD